MHWLPMLLAEGEQSPPNPFGGLMIPIMIAFAVFMVFQFRASARQRKEMQNVLAKIKKNDRVVTSAGIIGVVVAVKENEDEVILRVDETTGSRIRVLKSSVVRVVTEEQQQQGAQTAENKTS